MVSPLRVLFLSAEATPLAKVGGLGDVGGELPRALRGRGVEVRASLPLYASILPAEDSSPVEVVVQRGPQPTRASITQRRVEGVEVMLVGGEPVTADPTVYSHGEPEADKFVFWCLATLAACEKMDWKPDIVHAHDWHAAAAVARVWQLRSSEPFWANTASVLTIHNLGYPGEGAEPVWQRYRLPAAEGRGVPPSRRHVPLIVGLAKADALTTVSPTYAREIQTKDFGFGLEGLLRARRSELTGILNGLDPRVWNPKTDASLHVRYDSETLERREENKRALLTELRLEDRGRIPLLGFIGRMESQKGIDLLLHGLARVLDIPWQAVLLGTGQPELEAMATVFERGHPGRIRVVNRFEPTLARRIYGSADMVLVPSRYEPCGLVQMIGMRYGCVPVVRATGGLKDSVREGPSGTGFVFEQTSASDLAQAMHRALAAFADEKPWRALQRRAAREDFAWDRSAAKYIDVYRRARRRAG